VGNNTFSNIFHPIVYYSLSLINLHPGDGKPVDTDPVAEGADSKEILKKVAWYTVCQFVWFDSFRGCRRSGGIRRKYPGVIFLRVFSPSSCHSGNAIEHTPLSQCIYLHEMLKSHKTPRKVIRKQSGTIR
jgi:hypothetical protein